MKTVLIAMISFTSLFSHAGSTRLYSCFAKSTGHFQEFRLNIIDSETQGQRATFSDGLTTRNTLGTWNVNVKEDSRNVIVQNTNKSELKVKINKGRTISVLGKQGLAASIQGVVIVKPAFKPERTFKFSSEQAVCIEE